MRLLLGIVVAMVVGATALLVVDTRDAPLWIALLGIGALFLGIVLLFRPWRDGPSLD